MGPLPAHHNSDGKGQRASNNEPHSSDDLLSGTFTTLVTCVVVFLAGPSVIMRGTCDADGQTQGGNPPSVYLVVFREIVF